MDTPIAFPGQPLDPPTPNDPPMLTREAILRALDMEIEFVSVPEWAKLLPGGGTYVRSLEGHERDDFDEQITLTRKHGKKTTREIHMANARAKLVALAACDKNGARIFFDTDVELLGKKNARALQRVFEVAMRLSGMTEEEIEDLGKDSTSGQSDASGSDSPATSV